uniref:Helicase n=1 Tax=Marseillevirus LCMAC103 TaxID=2506604 RepID=A0A481YUH4_9VIRU|nr:MAG: helicase [Marseillevirus LCMAC103]
MAVSGFYIASHPWLDTISATDPPSLYKVGFTRDLRRRLHDSGYVLCFAPAEWRYAATFETAAASAEQLEACVKEFFREARPYGNELVAAPLADVVSAAARIANLLAIEAVQKTAPVYPRPPCRPRSDEAPLVDRGLLQAVEQLRAASAVDAAKEDAADAGAAEEDAAAVDAARGLLAADASEAAPVFVAEDRAYQAEATANCLSDLASTGRAVLQMACRCGKTKIAYDVLAAYLARGEKVLFLVPGLALLRQTAHKLVAYGLRAPIKLVGSDPSPVRLRGRAAAAMTTDWLAIAAFAGAGGARLVVSTYHSSGMTPDAFDLTVFDEAHRVCGDASDRPFNYVLLHHARGDKMYMTATPKYDAEISMKDRARFGGVSYRYHLRQGIDTGYVNPFRLDLVAAPPAGEGALSVDEEARAAMPRQIVAAMARPGVDKLLVFCRNIAHIRDLCSQTAEFRDSPCLRTCSGTVQPFRCFMAHSRLSAQARALVLAEFSAPGTRGVLFNCRLFQEGVEIPRLNAIFFAAPRHSPIEIIQSLCRPLNKMDGKPPSVVFVPVVSDPAAATSDPRNLRRYASIVPFIDALLDEDPVLYEHLLGTGATYSFGCLSILGKHSLSGSDCRDVLAAVKRAVRYGAAGRRGAAADRLLKVERVPWEWGFRELSRVVRVCGRYPKTVDAAEIAPGVFIHFYRWYRWALKAYDAGKRLQAVGAVAAMLRQRLGACAARAVDGGAERAADAADAESAADAATRRVCDFCGLARVSAARDGSALEPYQIQQLESLPGWRAFGRGPYPWGACMAFLEKWLDGHDGKPPMVEINRGGFVCLDATWMERLSGALTCVNQGDGKDRKGGRPGSGFTISDEKQADLDRICARHGLRWRKDRDPNGSLIMRGARYVGRTSFIQDANRRFSRHFDAHGTASTYLAEHFPGYSKTSIKYLYQEQFDVYKKKLMPPKWAHVRKRAARANSNPPKELPEVSDSTQKQLDRLDKFRYVG